MEPNYFVMLVSDLFFYADDPNNDPNISGDPYKTLFVARLVSNFIFETGVLNPLAVYTDDELLLVLIFAEL